MMMPVILVTKQQIETVARQVLKEGPEQPARIIAERIDQLLNEERNERAHDIAKLLRNIREDLSDDE
jgi:hypothetical protein